MDKVLWFLSGELCHLESFLALHSGPKVGWTDYHEIFGNYDVYSSHSMTIRVYGGPISPKKDQNQIAHYTVNLTKNETCQPCYVILKVA